MLDECTSSATTALYEREKIEVMVAVEFDLLKYRRKEATVRIRVVVHEDDAATGAVADGTADD